MEKSSSNKSNKECLETGHYLTLQHKTKQEVNIFYIKCCKICARNWVAVLSVLDFFEIFVENMDRHPAHCHGCHAILLTQLEKCVSYTDLGKMPDYFASFYQSLFLFNLMRQSPRYEIFSMTIVSQVWSHRLVRTFQVLYYFYLIFPVFFQYLFTETFLLCPSSLLSYYRNVWISFIVLNCWCSSRRLYRIHSALGSNIVSV